MSKILYGISISKGMSYGRLFYYVKQELDIHLKKVKDSNSEVERLNRAVEQVKEELMNLCDQTKYELGTKSAMIFEAHLGLLTDPEYIDVIINKIKVQKMNAEYAVMEISDYLSGVFSSMKDDYLKSRIADIKYISERLVAFLMGGNELPDMEGEQLIIVADDLTPGELMGFNTDCIRGLILNDVSKYSHTAILAASRNIPAVTSIDNKLLIDDNSKYAILDGDNGAVYLDPNSEQIDEYRHKIEMKKKEDIGLVSLKGKESITLYGRKVLLHANVGSLREIDFAIDQDAEGIGLFRSEYLFFNKTHPPSEEEQFRVYKEAATSMQDKRVILRTLDIGGDKRPDYLKLKREDNPALGYRAIRFCLDRMDIFKIQLKAMLRSSMYGDISIMFPMIISVKEIKRTKAIVKEVMEELSRDNIPYRHVPLGIMIETPAAVMISDILATEVDFFSIGTNDLIQYTLAADRLNPMLSNIFNTRHPAILRMIKMVVKNAHAKGIRVGVCGEMAADITLTQTLISMGIDELSVSPRYILPLRKRVREMDR